MAVTQGCWLGVARCEWREEEEQEGVEVQAATHGGSDPSRHLGHLIYSFYSQGLGKPSNKP